MTTPNLPPRWHTPVPPAMVQAGDGEDIADFIDAYTRVTQDTFAGPAGTPMQLRPWQRGLLGDVFARRADGRRRHRVALVGMPRKSGKALDVRTAMLTTVGWSTMGALKVGDEIFAPDGSVTKVVATSEVMTGHICYRVTLADGRSVIADQDHLWTLKDRFSRQDSVTVDTETMRSRLRIGSRSTHRERRYSVAVPGPLKLPDIDLPLDPYLLGAWLGDGSSAKAEITSADPGIVSAFRAAGYQISHRPPYAYGIRGGFLRALRDVGVLRNKHVPSQYLTAGISQRLALLQGLLDTDGGVTRGPTGSPVEFCSTTPDLAFSVLWLARSLGWKPSIAQSRATLYGKDCGPRWRVAWTAYRDDEPFRVQRKLDLLPSRPVRPQRSQTIQVVAVDPVPSRPVRCIQVDRPDGMFLAGKDLVPTHNSALSAGIALDGLLSTRGAEIYSVAADREQARIVFGHAKRMVEMSPDLSAKCKLYRDSIYVRDTGSIYRVLSSEHYTKEGLSPNLVVFDELHAQPSDELFNTMSLAQGARIDPLLLAITTAGVRTDTSGADSVCYRLYQYGQRIVSGEVDDPTFYLAWWAAGDEDRYTDVSTWQAANPAFGDLLDPEDLASAVSRTPEAEFRTKRLNQWVSASHAWLPQGAWDNLAKRREIPDGADVVLAFDGSYNSDSTALVVCQPGPVPYLDVVELWERPPGADPQWTVPIVDVEDAIRKACRKWSVAEIACDPYRWARTYQILEDERLPIVEYPQSPQRMTPATQRFYEAVMNQSLTHSGDPRLARHLMNAVLKVDSRGSRIVKDAHKSPRKIDLAVAALMALDRAANATIHYDVMASVW